MKRGSAHDTTHERQFRDIKTAEAMKVNVTVPAQRNAVIGIVVGMDPIDVMDLDPINGSAQETRPTTTH